MSREIVWMPTTRGAEANMPDAELQCLARLSGGFDCLVTFRGMHGEFGPAPTLSDAKTLCERVMRAFASVYRKARKHER